LIDGRDMRPPAEPPLDPVADVAPGDAAAETTGASLLGGGIWQLASRLWPQVSTLVLSVVVARFLGPDDFGRQSFIAFVSVCAISFFSGGLSVAVLRFVAELLGRGEQGAISQLVRWGIAIQFVGAAIGGGALVITGAAGAVPEFAWILAGVATAIAIAHTIPHSTLIAAQRFRTEAVIGLVTDLVAVPTQIAVLAAGGGIAGIFGVQAGVAMINLVWTSVSARAVLRERAPRGKPRPELWRARFTRYALYNTLIALLSLVIWRRSEFFFLDAYSTDAQIGIYSIAFATVTALVLIPETLAAVMAPAFATLFGAGQRDRMISGYGRGVRILLVLALPLTTATAALVPTLLEVVYGRDFAAAGDVLLVMIVLFPLLPLYQVSNAVLVGMGKAAIPLVIGIVAAVINIGLAFVFIPDLDAIGAAIAVTVAQGAVSAMTVAYAISLTGSVRIDPGTLLRALVASAVAGGAGFAVVATLGGVPGLALGSLTWLAAFGLAAVPLGVLSADDAAWIDEAAGVRFHGLVGLLARVLARRAPKPASV
jgi:O-antigen/teichoic acid export membrane protein